ncbi:hypothetical protein [Mycoplasma sp. 327]
MPKEKIAKPTIISKRKLVNMGECVELDGSIHFYVDQTLWTIVACIDVSTSKVLSLYFDKKSVNQQKVIKLLFKIWLMNTGYKK